MRRRIFGTARLTSHSTGNSRPRYLSGANLAPWSLLVSDVIAGNTMVSRSAPSNRHLTPKMREPLRGRTYFSVKNKCVPFFVLN